ncbi:MAG: type I methionyl aminopeptidase [Candidatus Delongbacteria bacterium]|jgi:methionyl aminopeptidase|nr:type I methionyl aminopeptidase [Candidatus Delongbacteria bacterium]
MIYLKTEEEIERMRECNRIVSMTHAEIARVIKPGISTFSIDKLSDEFIRDMGAVPGFLNYSGFPNSVCISVNDVVVHGIPDDTVLEDGDVVSVDIGAVKNGFNGDSCFTFEVGNVDEQVKYLLQVTRESLYKGIEKAVHGNRIGDIGNAVQKHAEKHGYGIVRELVGHGIGADLHEEPEVPNFGRKGTGPKLQRGMCIAIEPMITMGKRFIRQEKDGWTVRTIDHKPAAHFEHTIAITKEKADILSDFSIIDKAIEQNKLIK